MRESETVVRGATEYRPPFVMFWGGLLLFVIATGIGLLALTDRSGKPVEFWVVLLGVAELLATWGAGVYAMIYPLRVRIMVDDKGLRWRGMSHGWRLATWSEVSDYYDKFRRTGDAAVDRRTTISPIIVTKSGIIKVVAGVTGTEELKQVVRERATAARVSEWQPLGTRRVDDWPQTFGYWTPGLPLRIAAHLMIYAMVLSLAGWGLFRLYNWYASLSTLAETQRITLALWFGFLLLFSVPAMVGYRYAVLWKRRKERFTVTPETLSYTSAVGQSIEIPWGEVGDYFYKTGNGWEGGTYALVLRGADEKQIAWSRWLPDWARLLAVVQEYAPQPAFMKNNARLWREKSANESRGGSDPSTWQGGAVGIGRRVFTLKNTSNITLLSCLCLFCAFLIVACALAIGETVAKKDNQSMAIPVGTTSFVVVGTAYALACFFRVRIETDDMGVTQYTVFGKKHLPWYAVADYSERFLPRSSRGVSNGFVRVTGKNGVRITIWDTCDGFAELKDEIERYAPPPKMGWKTP